jgi:hypothetical protein
MQDALSKGAQAYVEQQQLREDNKQLQRRCDRLEASASELNSLIATLRSEMGQLQEHYRAEGAQSQLVAWAPVDMHPDQILAAVSDAAGLSSSAFVSVERRFVPRDNRSSTDSSNGSEQGRQRLPMALYAIRLVSSRFLHTVLGGRTRLHLRRKQVPIWVEEALDEEGRKARKRLVPVARQLRAEGVKVRWRGARLEKQRVRGDGRRDWVEVLPGPPEGAPAAGSGSDGAGAAAAQ